MRQFFIICLLLSSFILLMSCAATRGVFNPNFTDEAWKKEIETNADKWKLGASRWFLLGEPNTAEMDNRRAPESAGISTTEVQTSDFNHIVSKGDFQLQIFGSDKPSVYVYGPNPGTQAISVRISGDVLFVTQTQSVPAATMEHVIIRVGVKNLSSLTQSGNGTIEAIHIVSSNLCINSIGSGKIYLAGHYYLGEVKQSGSGCIFLFGAFSRDLKIKAMGSGLINISGNVGVRSIMHQGSSSISIIGAYSEDLSIDAAGSGRIGICGIVNLCSLVARDDIRVYIFEARGKECANIYVYDKACVGVAGSVNKLGLLACNDSVFYGRYLCARIVYVRTNNHAHANVSAATRVYASANEASTIYFYGDPNVLDAFTTGSANIFPLPELGSCRWYQYTLQENSFSLGKKKQKSHHHRRLVYYKKVKKEVMLPGEG